MVKATGQNERGHRNNYHHSNSSRHYNFDSSMRAVSTSLKTVLSRIDFWDLPVTEHDLKGLNPMKLTHPWLVASAWYILCLIAPRDNGGLAKRQTVSLDDVWLRRLPCCEAEIDPDLSVFAPAFLCSFLRRRYNEEQDSTEAAFITILGH